MGFLKNLAISLTCFVGLAATFPQNAVGQVIQNDVIISLQSSGDDQNEIIIENKWNSIFTVDLTQSMDQQPFVQIYNGNGQPLVNKVLLNSSRIKLLVPKQQEYIVVITARMVSTQWYLPGT